MLGTLKAEILTKNNTKKKQALDFKVDPPYSAHLMCENENFFAQNQLKKLSLKPKICILFHCQSTQLSKREQ